MNLYLITQIVNNDYDTYDAAVVVAESENEARHICPDRFYEWSKELNSWVFGYSSGRRQPDTARTWTLPSNVEVELIGTTTRPKGIVLASFNAG